MLTRAWRRFFALESASGMILFFTLLVALLLANSPWGAHYLRFTDLPIQIRIGDFSLHKSATLWINEGLMALFFLLLTLEIKREVVVGELANPSQLLLPVMAALGGIMVPVLCFLMVAYDNPQARPGWAIVTTTDIAFVMGFISCFGRRIPTSLKVFLIALSIIDDILAVTIIALVYTHKLSALMLSLAGVLVVVLLILNWRGVNRIAAYALIGLFIWILTVKSGVHATLAGVAVGLTIPLRAKTVDDLNVSPLHQLEHSLHPWVAFLVLPLFVFVNGGIPWPGGDWQQLLQPLALGIVLGLVVGKTLGVFLFSALVIGLGWAKMPARATWRLLLGVSALTGIGFTMSLFLANLALPSVAHVTLASQAVIGASVVSAALASILILCKK